MLCRRLDMPKLYRTLLEIAEGMAYLHDCGLMHCDLNGELENVAQWVKCCWSCAIRCLLMAWKAAQLLQCYSQHPS